MLAGIISGRMGMTATAWPAETNRDAFERAMLEAWERAALLPGNPPQRNPEVTGLPTPTEARRVSCKPIPPPDWTHKLTLKKFYDVWGEARYVWMRDVHAYVTRHFNYLYHQQQGVLDTINFTRDIRGENLFTFEDVSSALHTQHQPHKLMTSAAGEPDRAIHGPLYQHGDTEDHLEARPPRCRSRLPPHAPPRLRGDSRLHHDRALPFGVGDGPPETPQVLRRQSPGWVIWILDRCWATLLADPLLTQRWRRTASRRGTITRSLRGTRSRRYWWGGCLVHRGMDFPWW